jgi:hypothetical protein
MDRATNILGGFVLGVSIVGGLWAMLQVGIWIGRTDVKTLHAATRDIHAEYIEAYQQAPAAMTIAQRRERFAPVEINMGAIIEIESSGDPRAVSPVGCRGLCQIAHATWLECTARLGVAWTWEEDAWDPGCNRAVGNYYVNHRIPEMLRAYDIPDSEATRIGAYNWGIGRLRDAWRQYGHDWLSYAPNETKDYVVKYAAILSRQAN